MSSISSLNKKKAEKLHALGRELFYQGDEDGALQKYKEALEFDPEKSESHYNIGLIYKYRNDWANSLAYNRDAYRLAPEDEAARWNLAIAATALRDWATARRAWLEGGIKIADGEGPIDGDLGPTPVRLDPEGKGEVVWARRIDPVRARITNIPLPASGFAYGDIVLHDGAATGHRVWEDREYPVFNVFELFEASDFSTFKMTAHVPGQSELDALSDLFWEYKLCMEDWTSSVYILCKACSKGTPHDHHDEGSEQAGEWDSEREIGIAARSLEDIQRVLADQAAAGIAVQSIACELNAEERG